MSWANNAEKLPVSPCPNVNSPRLLSYSFDPLNTNTTAQVHSCLSEQSNLWREHAFPRYLIAPLWVWESDTGGKKAIAPDTGHQSQRASSKSGVGNS